MDSESSYWQRNARRRRTRRQMLCGFIAVAAGSSALALACGARNNPTTSSSNTATAAAGGPAPFSGPPAKIVLSVGAVDPSYLVPYVARAAGIFAKNGLDATLQVIPGPQAVAALLAGQLQFAHAGGGEVLAANVAGGELTVIAAPAPVFAGYVYSVPTVKTAADAKGKKAAITSPGGTFDIVLHASFQKMGLDPEKDITFIATGSIPNAFTALVNGSVQIAAQPVGPNSLKLESQGFFKLYDPADIPLDAAGVTVGKTWLAANHAVAQRYVDSMVQASVKIKQDRAGTLDVMRKDLEMTDDQVLSTVYDYYKQDRVTPTLPFPKADLFPAQLAVIAQKTEAAKNFDVTKMLDQSFVQSAADRHLDKG
jgi:ABC-type nitrate/sulfonate/bicarbonate transport system substrate-binding protein